MKGRVIIMTLTGMKEFISELENKIENTNKKGFTPKQFTCSTGGLAYIAKELKIEEDIITHTQKFNYKINNNVAYSGTLEILCKSTDLCDDEGEEIYLTPSKMAFVCKYEDGSPSEFDKMSIEPPLVNGEWFYI